MAKRKTKQDEYIDVEIKEMTEEQCKTLICLAGQGAELLLRARWVIEQVDLICKNKEMSGNVIKACDGAQAWFVNTIQLVNIIGGREFNEIFRETMEQVDKCRMEVREKRKQLQLGVKAEEGTPDRENFSYIISMLENLNARMKMIEDKTGISHDIGYQGKSNDDKE